MKNTLTHNCILTTISLLVICSGPIYGQSIPERIIQDPDLPLINNVYFTPDSTKIVTTYTEAIVWDIQTGEKLRVFENSNNSVTCVGISPDGKLIAIGGQVYKGRIFNFDTGELLHSFDLELPREPNSFVQLEFTPDNKQFITANVVGDLILWYVASGESKFITDVYGLAKWMQIFPDGKRLLIKNKVISISDGEILHDFQGRPFITNDGKKIFHIYSFPGLYENYENSLISVWDANTYEKLKEYPVFQLDAEFLDFSPDGKLLMFNEAVSPTIQSHMLDVETNTGVRNFTPAGKEMYEFDMAKFSPDGKKLATVIGNTLRIWDISDLASQVKGTNKF